MAQFGRLMLKLLFERIAHPEGQSRLAGLLIDLAVLAVIVGVVAWIVVIRS